MPAFIITLSDEEVSMWDAYVAWQQRLPAVALSNVGPEGGPADIDELLAVFLAPLRAMIRDWYTQQTWEPSADA